MKAYTDRSKPIRDADVWRVILERWRAERMARELQKTQRTEANNDNDNDSHTA